MPLNGPVDKDSIPMVGGDSPPTPGDRFTSAPLSPTALAFLQQSLARHQHRRQVYRAGHLRVCLDGEARWPCAPGVGVYGPFGVPPSAAYLEIFGDDDDGALLLAVFPLPAPEVLEADGTQHLWVTLEGGQTVVLDLVLGERTSGEVRAYVIQLSYTESAAVAQGRSPPSVQ